MAKLKKPNKQTLQQELNKCSLLDLARRYSTTPYQIRQWALEYGIWKSN